MKKNNQVSGLAINICNLLSLAGMCLSMQLAAKAPDESISSDQSIAAHQTIFVDQGKIYTAAGEAIVMRGFNEMFVWSSDKTGARWLPEMAKTGANTVRLAWDHDDKNPQDLVTLIERSIAHKMIAIPECHNATGKWGKALESCINFWNNPLLINTIQHNRRWTILNIANEAGDHNISDKEFIETYSKAIQSLRKWGYTVPIMIDASAWGQNLDQLLRVGPQLQQQDPLNNIIFSVHSYWPEEVTLGNYQKIAQAAEQQRIAMIVGEGPSVTRVGQCDNAKPLPYLAGMQILHEHNIGWLNWSWGGMKNADCDQYRYFDITKEGRFGDWQHEPGANIVAHSPYSVMQTSARPASFYSDGKVSVSGVYIKSDKIVLSPGESTRIQVLVAPVNAANKHYSLQISGDKNAISLTDGNAKITALTTGTARLTATTDDGQISWSTEIQVQ